MLRHKPKLPEKLDRFSMFWGSIFIELELNINKKYDP
jgi:hypothetical protein